MLDKLNQPKGSTIGVLRDGRTLQEAIDDIITRQALDTTMYVKSREELLAAIQTVNTLVRKSTRIVLTRDFAPWNETADVDLTFVSLEGEGQATKIDCSGLQAGTRAVRFFTTNAASVGNISYQGGDKITNIQFFGPSQTGTTDGVLFENVASISVQGLTVMGFRDGVQIGSNAYIIHFYRIRIDRCGGVHLRVLNTPNTGEGIHLYGGTLSTSGGTLLQCDNPNSAIRAYGTSLDYAGAVAKANRGSIELFGCHMEFENGTNDLKEIPFQTTAAQDSRLLIDGGEILSYKGTTPISQQAVFYSVKGGAGITVRDTKLVYVNTQSGDIKQGDGQFSALNLKLFDNNGNVGIARGQAPTDSLAGDPTFTMSPPADWYIQQAVSEITDRWTSGTGTLVTNTDVKYSTEYGGSMEVTKIFGNGSNFTVRMEVPVTYLNEMTARLRIMAPAGTVGTIYMNLQFGRLRSYDSLGRPVFARSDTARQRSVDLSTSNGSWISALATSGRITAPRWATHFIVSINMASLQPGTKFYIGETGVFTL